MVRSLAGAVALSFLLLAGCAPASRLVPADLAFDAASAQTVVVIGITPFAVRMEPTGAFTSALRPAAYALVWKNLESGEEFDVAYSPLERAGEHRATDDTVYAVTLVPPGRYRLVQVVDEFRGQRQPRITLYGPSPAFSFVARPGEVIYAGDFRFDTALHPAQLLGVSRNEKEARRALALTPGIRGELKAAAPVE